MKIQIKSTRGLLLFEGHFSTLAEAVCAAINGGANLYGANLSGANLYGANLSGADLYGANLYGAKNAELAIAQTRILPAGNIIGFKKCAGGEIAELLIPTEAKRSHAFGRKCRAEYVRVLAVTKDGKPVEKAVSGYDNGKTEYIPGKIVRCDKWSEDWRNECAGGIHFFITREEAEAYVL